VITFEVFGDANELSWNKRSHWRKVHSLKKQWRERARLSLALTPGVEPVQGRVRVSYILRRGRRLDPDNAASTGVLKVLLDSIVEAGLLKDDTLLYCTRGEVTQEVGKQYRECPSVVVILEEIEDARTQEGGGLQEERAEESPAPGKKGRVPAGDRPKGRGLPKHDQEVAG